MIFIVLSCKRESKFNLEKDLFQFSEKMENADTIEITANLSACLSSGFEKYMFVKENDSLFLETFSEESSFEKKAKPCPKCFILLNSKILYPLKIILNI